MSTPASPLFAFDQQQRNTLNVSGLAAYVQRPPRDRVGWVHARQVWLPGWRPAKWAYEVQHLEVTFASYELLERYEAEQLDHELWDVLMLTAYSTFLTDDLVTVEGFFAQHTDRPEYARHPDRVKCPHEWANEKLSSESPARWNLVRRAWIARLLGLQEQGTVVSWDTPVERLEGRITEVDFSSFVLTTATGGHRKHFSDRYGAQFYRREEDGYIRRLWHEPTARETFNGEMLPVWDADVGEWHYLELADEDIDPHA